MSEFFLDFTGVAINEKSQQAPDPGAYAGKITGASVSLKDGKTPQVKVTVVCTTPSGDVEWSEWISIHGADAEKTKKLMQVWGALFLSIGFSPEQLKDAKIGIDKVVQGIVGKGTFVEIFNETKPDGKIATSMSFFKPLDYQAALEEIAKTEGGMDAWAKARAEKRKARNTVAAATAPGVGGFPAAGFPGAPATGFPAAPPAGFGAPPAGFAAPPAPAGFGAPPANFGGAPAGFGGAPPVAPAQAQTQAPAAPAGFGAPAGFALPANPAAAPAGLPTGLPNGMPTGLAGIVGALPGR